MFDNLGASEEQLDFPIVYASGLSGFAKLNEEDESSDMRPLFDTILKYTPAPSGSPDAPLQLQISQLDYDNYTGRLGIGRILNGKIRPGQTVAVIITGGGAAKVKQGLPEQFALDNPIQIVDNLVLHGLLNWAAQT